MQGTSTQVSVIIPTYNTATELIKCVEALQEQNFSKEKYEIIVVDDGSTDSTASILKDYPVHYYYQKNRGPASARNKGVEMSKGSIILFTDSDCIPAENWISEMVSSLQAPEIVGVKGVYRTAQRKLWARFAQVEFYERYRLLLKNDYIDMIDTYSAGYKKDTFLSINGFDTSFTSANHEDTDLSYKMSLKGYKMVFNPKAVVWHSGHPDTLTKYMRLKFWRGYWRMVVYERYSTKMLKDSYTPQMLKFQILFVFLSVLTLILGLFSPVSMFYLFFWGVLSFIATSLPFMAVALGQDTTIGLLTPFFLFLRALALGCGVFYRLLVMVLQKCLKLKKD